MDHSPSDQQQPSQDLDFLAFAPTTRDVNDVTVNDIDIDEDEDGVADEEQVRALAAALAPQVRELETLMDDPLLRSSSHASKLSSKSKISRVFHEEDEITVGEDSNSLLNNNHDNNNNHNNNPPKSHIFPTDDDDDYDDDYDMAPTMDDDDMDQELEQLAFSEDILRRELDLAKDFASFFGSSPMAFFPSQDPPAVSSLNLNHLNVFTLSSGVTPANLFATTNSSNSSQPPDPPQAQAQQSTYQPVVTVSPIPTLASVPLQQYEADVDLDDIHEEELQSQQQQQQQEQQDDDGMSLHNHNSSQQLAYDGSSGGSGVRRGSSNSPVPHENYSAASQPLLEQPKPAHRSSIRESILNRFQGSASQGLSVVATYDDADAAATQEEHSSSSLTPPAKSSKNKETLESNNKIDDAQKDKDKYTTPISSARRRLTQTPQSVPPRELPQTSVVLYKSPAKTYTSTDHFERLQLQKEPQGAWYSIDLTAHLVDNYNNMYQRHHRHYTNNNPTTTTSSMINRTIHTNNDQNNTSMDSHDDDNDNHHNDNDNDSDKASLARIAAGLGIKEYCLSITQWKRLFVGLRLEGDDEKQQSRQTTPQKSRQSRTVSQDSGTSGDDQEDDPPQTPSHQQQQQQQQQQKQQSNETINVRAPARTVSIRIRPDVLCGAVIDAVMQTLMDCPHASIIKRQGGHLQATVTGQASTAASMVSAASSSSKRNHHQHQSRRSSTPSAASRDVTFLVDVQLCTHKSAQCERVLLLRIYHLGEDDREGAAEADLWSPSSTRTTRSSTVATPATDDGRSTTPTTNTTDQNHPQDDSFLSIIEEDASTTTGVEKGQEANMHLREACALIQRIESPDLARKIRPLVMKTPSSADTNVFGLRDLVSEHLLQNYRACPSVLQPETTITLPALSPQDWPVIQASWSWIHAVWDELETRELTYLSLLGLSSSTAMLTMTTSTDSDDGTTQSTENQAPVMLATSPPVPRFGAFPALPTLDVQYCSQLRRLSREAMIGQLLKAASVLEEYARQAEYQCANLIDLLRPTFTHYGVATPSLPKPAPLAAYPLDYTPPQALCPPWGLKVMEALNQVAAMTHAAGQENNTNALSPFINNTVEGSNEEEKANNALSQSLDSIALAETAVQMIYEAFQQQDDEEHSARLARKNLQVMDRLAKMQEHNRASIKALSVATTDNAIAAADDFFSKAEHAIVGLKASAQIQASAETGNTTGIHTEPWREVPLLKWTMGVGGSSGTCTITAHQLLFTPTKYIPLIGQNQSTWFCLKDVEFGMSQTQATLLNPLSTTIQVLESTSGFEAYNFKPSSAGPRLKSFLDIVQKESMIEDKDAAVASVIASS